ncbi:hypothetical protein NEF87_002778 [Candidatus Lokiarchaeum ossiferum]|uniref:LamG-like jellyroll fold domain-containing protein n=1 Tax=Candidatus Lokiarchaeum ossiferum TaxID=2951803 RepID=A0ABY6HSL0_9ARCH|nr:hypothetical protein NEF87_002778 [Candidatus Lokiarchaeum sp. B-35]
MNQKKRLLSLYALLLLTCSALIYTNMGTGVAEINISEWTNVPNYGPSELSNFMDEDRGEVMKIYDAGWGLVQKDIIPQYIAGNKIWYSYCVKVTGGESNDYGGVNLSPSTINTGAVGMRIHAGTSLKYWLGDGQEHDTFIDVETDQWYHIGCSYESDGQFEAYLDGEMILSEQAKPISNLNYVYAATCSQSTFLDDIYVGVSKDEAFNSFQDEVTTILIDDFSEDSIGFLPLDWELTAGGYSSFRTVELAESPYDQVLRIYDYGQIPTVYSKVEKKIPAGFGSIEWDLKTDSPGNNNGYFGLMEGDNWLISIGIINNQFRVYYHNDHASYSVYDTNVVASNQWTHLKMEYDGEQDDCRIFVNGVEVRSTPFNTKYASFVDGLYLHSGETGSGKSYYDNIQVNWVKQRVDSFMEYAGIINFDDSYNQDPLASCQEWSSDVNSGYQILDAVTTHSSVLAITDLVSSSSCFTKLNINTPLGVGGCVEGWISGSSIINNAYMGINFGDNYWLLSVGINNGHFKVYHRTSYSTYSTAVSTIEANPNQWYFVCLYYDGMSDICTVSINGVTIGQYSLYDVAGITSIYLHSGENGGGTSYYDSISYDWANEYDAGDARIIDFDRDHLSHKYEETHIYESGLKTSPWKCDSDNDRVNDWDEICGIYGYITDPTRIDSEPIGSEDGLNDYLELFRYHTDPTHYDSDRDGLTDGDEVNLYGTDPTTADSDGDGLTDGEEINGYDMMYLDELYHEHKYATYYTNPLLVDSDNDNWSDKQELDLIQADLDQIHEPNPAVDNYRYLDPMCRDSDLDFLPDGWEEYYGLDPCEYNSELELIENNVPDIYYFFAPIQEPDQERVSGLRIALIFINPDIVSPSWANYYSRVFDKLNYDVVHVYTGYTRNQFYNELYQWTPLIQADDELFIMIQGHGLVEDNEEETPLAYFTLYDDDEVFDQDVGEISGQEFLNRLKLFSAYRKCVFFDTCFAGKVLENFDSEITKVFQTTDATHAQYRTVSKFDKIMQNAKWEKRNTYVASFFWDTLGATTLSEDPIFKYIQADLAFGSLLPWSRTGYQGGTILNPGWNYLERYNIFV